MAITIADAITDTIPLVKDSLMAAYGPDGADESEMQKLAEAVTPGMVEGILQHILDNAEAGGDPVE